MNKSYCISFAFVGKGAEPRAPAYTSTAVGLEGKWMNDAIQVLMK